MKRLILTSVCSLLLSSFVFAQEIELQNLNRRIPALIEQGNFDEVVSTAEKIVKIEKQGGAKNLPNYAAALMNLALWKKQRLAKKPPVMLVQDATSSVVVLLKEAEDTEKLFRELLDIFQNRLEDPSQLAAAQSELAAFIAVYYDSPEKIEEVKNLYENALALREKHLGADSDSALATMLQLSAFYFQTGEFEKFVPLYQKFVSTVEKKYGENHKRLIPAWRLFSNFLITTDRRDEAITLLRRVVALTGRNEILPVADYKLVKRAAEKLDDTIGRPQVRYTDSSPIIIPNPTDVQRNRPQPGGTYSRPQTTSGLIVTGRLQLPTAISGANNISVNVLIDENGSVVEAIPNVPNEKVKKEISKKVLKWKFKPFIEAGVGRKMRGVVNILYYKPITRDKPKKEKKT
jgi:tetratricopeptide (TPR) repeat protein